MHREASGDGWAPYSALQVHGTQDPGSPRHMPLSPPMNAASSSGFVITNTDDMLYSSVGRPTSSPAMRVDYEANGVELTFRDVSVAVKRNCISENILRRKSRVLVRAAIGRFPAGHVHGIVALSEESATALADVLSGRIAPVEGQVWADGLPARVALYRESVGVVRQLSWTMPEFTVEENLHFAGAMRRAFATAAERQKRSEIVAAVLALDLSVKVRALSTAARRRMDVAMEMMSAPPVLFVHNPLWGLDCHSRADFSVYLARVARTFGTTVVLTLPKLELSAFDLLHSLVILGAGGHTVFSGKRAALADYFVARVQAPLHQIPTPVRPAAASSGTVNDSGREAVPLITAHTSTNAPTFASARGSTVDGLTPLPLRRRSTYTASPAAAAGDYDDDEGGDSRVPSLLSQRPATDVIETPPPAPPPARNYAASGSDVATSGMDLDGGDCVMDHVQLWASVNATDRYAAAFFDSHEKRRLDQLIDESIANARSTPVPARWVANPLRQPSSFTKFGRLMYAVTKQRAVTVDWYVGWCILTVAVAVCLWLADVQSMSQEGMFNVRGIIFFMIAITLQLNNTLVRSYSEEVDRFRHLKASGVAPTLVQLAVTVLTMMLTRILYLAPVSIGVIVVMKNDVGLVLAILLGITSWAHITITYVVVLFVRTVRYASAITSAIDAAMLFFSGFLVNTESPPAATLSAASLPRYAYGATVQHVLRLQNYTCDGQHNTSYCYTTEGYLRLEGFEDDTVNGAAVALAFFGAVATLIAWARMWSL